MKKKSNSKKIEHTFDHLQKMTNDMLIQMKGLKAKYDRMDPVKKKKLMTTIAGATALLIGVAAIKKMRKKK
jgi:hypothetical protein